MKLLLIATTALVCVTSLVTAGTLPERPLGSRQSGLDTNGEFLCNHGFKIHTTISSGNSGSGSSGYYANRWVRAATPVIGKGKAVDEITIEDSPASSFQGPSTFLDVAIYSGKTPRRQLVEKQLYQTGCSRVNVPISPVMLKKGRTYWVVESAWLATSGTNSYVWLYDRKRTTGALQQSGYSCDWSCSHYPPFSHHFTSRWKPITRGVPYARVGESDEASEGARPAQSLAAGDGSVTPAIIPTRRDTHQGSIPRYPP